MAKSVQTSGKTVEELERELAKTREELANAHADMNNMRDELDTTRVDLKNALDNLTRGSNHLFWANLTETWLNGVLDKAANLRSTIEGKALDVQLSEVDRRRLLGSGVRRYGFIDKVSDIITVSEDIPHNIDIEEFKRLIRLLEIVRNINVIIQQSLRLNSDFLLILGDEAYRLALTYYGFAREAAHRGVPGAQEIFKVLRQYFRTGHRHTDEPTEQEIERDLKALLHGKKDGEIIVKHTTPKTAKGERVVVDETYKNTGHFKATEEGAIED